MLKDIKLSQDDKAAIRELVESAKEGDTEDSFEKIRALMA